MKAKAAKRVAEAKITQLVETYGRPIDTTPTEALLDEVRWTAGHVAWLRAQVQRLEEAAVAWGVAEQVSGKDERRIFKAAPNVLIALYQGERRHLVDVCKAAITAGIEERRVRVAEAEGQLIADALGVVLADLGLADDPRVNQAVNAMLIRLDQGQIA